MIRNRRSWYDSNSVFSVTVCINRTSSNKTKYTYTNLNSKTCHGNFISHIHHLDKQISHIFGRYCDERGTWEHDETQRINRRAYYSCASFRYHHSAPPGDASLATPTYRHPPQPQSSHGFSMLLKNHSVNLRSWWAACLLSSWSRRLSELNWNTWKITQWRQRWHHARHGSNANWSVSQGVAEVGI